MIRRNKRRIQGSQEKLIKKSLFLLKTENKKTSQKLRVPLKRQIKAYMDQAYKKGTD